MSIAVLMLMLVPVLLAQLSTSGRPGADGKVSWVVHLE